MSESSVEVRRKNGLEWPWHELQIATWILYPLVIAEYFGLLLPLLWRNIYQHIIPTIVFGITSIIALYASYKTCAIDPADDAISGGDNTSKLGCSCCNATSVGPTLSSKNKRDAENGHDFEEENETIYCYICEENVSSTSKHCRYCNKCVKRFDHHCKWLNTCVGEKNYRYFLMIVSSITIQTTISLIISIIFVVEAYAYKEKFQRRVDGAMGFYIPSEVAGGLLIVSSALLFPLVLMVYQLAIFHLTLLYHGQTTYEFIVSEQKKAREKEEQKNKNKNKNKPQSPRITSAPNSNKVNHINSTSSHNNNNNNTSGHGSGNNNNNNNMNSPSKKSSEADSGYNSNRIGQAEPVDHSTSTITKKIRLFKTNTTPDTTTTATTTTSGGGGGGTIITPKENNSFTQVNGTNGRRSFKVEEKNDLELSVVTPQILSP